MKKKQKLLLLQVRRSVGEIDWIIPILYLLKKKGYKIFTFFDDKKNFESLKKNELLFKLWKSINIDFHINKKSDKILIKIIFFTLLNLKNFLKNNLFLESIIGKLKTEIYEIKFFLKKYRIENFNLFLLSDNNYSNLCLKFKQLNNKIKIARFPTSPWVENIDNRKYLKLYKRYLFIDQQFFTNKNIAHKTLGKNFVKLEKDKKLFYVGNPKYANWWIKKIFKKNKKTINTFKILVATRSWEKNFSKQSFESIIKKIMKLTKINKNIKITFKTHPSRQEENFLKKILNLYDKKQWRVSNNHLIDLCKDNFIGITLNSSACTDIVKSGIPCLEFWYNEKDKLNMIHGKTVYELQKIVKKLKNFEDLNNEFQKLQKKIYYNRLVKYQYAQFKKIYSLHKTNLMINKLLKYDEKKLL